MLSPVSNVFDLMVPHGKLERCIVQMEDGLRSVKRTPYHRILGKDFLHHSREMADCLIYFHQQVHERGTSLSAIYLEMNGFEINPEQWYCEFFGYKVAGSIWELDWLSSSDATMASSFVLTGMESVQEAFATLYCDKKQPLGVKIAADLAMHLVTGRFMQLVAASHRKAKRRYPELKNVQVIASAHDWETFHST